MRAASASSILAQGMTMKSLGIGVRLAGAVAALVALLLVPPARAANLTGTWQGTVTVDGQMADFTAAFSEAGYVLFEYTNNKGLVRTVELNAPGQIQFVPPGGGVKTVAVESVVKRPGRVSYVLHFGFERASGGYLDQRYISEQHDYALTNEGLSVRVVSRAATYFGDRGGPIGGPLKAEILEGVLTRME